MARIARVVAPGIPHHIPQRGDRRQETFFCAGDYQAYLALLGEWCRYREVEVWAYCLMPNHVHVIAVPTSEDGLRRAIGEVRQRYTRRVNFPEGWRGRGSIPGAVARPTSLAATARSERCRLVWSWCASGRTASPREWPKTRSNRFAAMNGPRDRGQDRGQVFCWLIKRSSLSSLIPQTISVIGLVLGEVVWDIGT